MAQIVITTNGVARTVFVDDDMFEHLTRWKWHIGSHGYVVRNAVVDGRRTKVRMHRVVIGALDGEIVDHINRNPRDNRSANLRICTHVENCRNSDLYARPPSGRSRFIGVCLCSRGNKWRAALKISGKRVFTGEFDDEVAAAKAYDCAVARHLGPAVRTNRSLGLL